MCIYIYIYIHKIRTIYTSSFPFPMHGVSFLSISECFVILALHTSPSVVMQCVKMGQWGCSQCLKGFKYAKDALKINKEYAGTGGFF